MSVHTLLLSGPVEKPLQFPIARLFKISEGEWEIAIASTSLIYKKTIDRTLAGISSNFVMGQNISSNNEVIAERQLLGITTIGKVAGEKHTISFKRDFFIINQAGPVLSFFVENIEKEEREPLSGAHAFLYLYLRRRR